MKISVYLFFKQSIIKAILIIFVVLLFFQSNSFSQTKYCSNIPKGSKIKVMQEFLIPANTSSVSLKEISFYINCYDDILKKNEKVKVTIKSSFIPKIQNNFYLNGSSVDYDRTVRYGKEFTVEKINDFLEGLNENDFSIICEDGSKFSFRFYIATYNDDNTFAYSGSFCKLKLEDFITNIYSILSITLDNSKAVDY